LSFFFRCFLVFPVVIASVCFVSMIVGVRLVRFLGWFHSNGRLPVQMLVLGVVLIATPARAEPTPGQIVSGEVRVSEPGPLHIFLVDAEQFKERFSGRRLIIEVGKKQLKAGKVGYYFRGVKPGVYGVRCFLDRNGNRRLDRGLLGPQEPWGMSFRGKWSWGIPRFSQISFRVGREKAHLRPVRLR